MQVPEIANVYEEVDEKEYSKRRRDKMEDDWIIDDGDTLMFVILILYC